MTQPAPHPASLLEALARWDTPTICNALEVVAPERRLTGFTVKPLVCPFPDLPPLVGYARTATIRATSPSSLSAADQRAHDKEEEDGQQEDRRERQGLRRFHRCGLLGASVEFALQVIAFDLKWAIRYPAGAPSPISAAIILLWARSTRHGAPWCLIAVGTNIFPRFSRARA